MKLNFTKTIFIIVFVVFLGMNKVSAKTCGYREDTSRTTNTVYIIVLDSSGKATNIIYRELFISSNSSRHNTIKKEEDKTSIMTIDFTSCPDSISVSGNSITSGGTYLSSTSLGGAYEATAKTCLYSYATTRVNNIYSIELEGSGKVKKIIYKQTEVQTDKVLQEIDYTADKTFNYNYCPSSISVDSDQITIGGNYVLVPNAGENNSNTNTNSNNGTGIGSLKPSPGTTYCGTLTGIPTVLPATTALIYMLLQILIPLILIIVGMMDLLKAISSQKEDEIKKGQQTLMKRLIAAVIVFLVFAIVKMAVSFFTDNDTVVKCMDCFIKNNCGS